MSSLADVLVGNPDDTARIPQLRQGVVTAINPLTVLVGAAATAQVCRALAGVSASVGDCVSVLSIAGDRLVLGKASQSTMAPLNLGPNGYGGGYLGLNWGGDYLVMSDGTNTFVSTPSASGSVFIRSGKNGGNQLVIQSDGNHSLTGKLTSTSDLVSNAWVYAQGGYVMLGGGGVGWYNNGDNAWVRATNDKNIYTGNEIRGGNFRFQSGGYVFTHYQDTDTGLYYDADGQFRFIANGQNSAQFTASRFTVPNGCHLNLYAANDDNHSIWYNSGIGGPEIDGYQGVRIFTPSSGAIYDFQNSGYAYSPYGWLTSSSVALKENIEDLTAERAVDIVQRLRPVTYDMVDGTHPDQIGFIAEWTQDVAPHAVAAELNADDETLETIGAGIDYAKFTPILTRVLQHVLDRLDDIDRRLNQETTT